MDIKYYRKLKNINRLSREAIVRPYNLAEHQYGVTVLFMHFAALEDVEYSVETIKHILHHDVLETLTSDLPYTVKNFNNTTRQCWETIESEIMRNHPEMLPYSDYVMEKNFSRQQLSLFKVCDLLELWLFCREEQALGNGSLEIGRVVVKCVEIIKEYSTGYFESVLDFMDRYEYDG